MKRIALCLILCILLSFSLSGCAQNKDGNPFAIRIAGKAPWLDASNIVMVEEYVTYHGVQPSASRTIYYAEDSATIEKIVKYYRSSFLIPTSLNKLTRLNGGRSETVRFTLSDGSTEVLYFYHGCYKQGNHAYRVINTSHYDRSKMNSYVQLTSQRDTCDVLRTNTSEPEKLGEVDVSNWRLKYTGCSFEKQYDAVVYIEIDFAKLYIVSDTLCYLVEYNSGFYEYFELMDGETFAPLIEIAVEKTAED